MTADQESVAPELVMDEVVSPVGALHVAPPVVKKLLVEENTEQSVLTCHS